MKQKLNGVSVDTVNGVVFLCAIAHENGTSHEGDADLLCGIVVCGAYEASIRESLTVEGEHKLVCTGICENGVIYGGAVHPRFPYFLIKVDNIPVEFGCRERNDDCVVCGGCACEDETVICEGNDATAVSPSRAIVDELIRTRCGRAHLFDEFEVIDCYRAAGHICRCGSGCCLVTGNLLSDLKILLCGTAANDCANILCGRFAGVAATVFCNNGKNCVCFLQRGITKQVDNLRH